MTLSPEDANGVVLSRIAARGVDLSIERDVEFAHLAERRDAAETFAAAARDLGYLVRIYEPDEESLEEGDDAFDVVCVRRMVPSRENITRVERELAALARVHSCREDGWGFME